MLPNTLIMTFKIGSCQLLEREEHNKMAKAEVNQVASYGSRMSAVYSQAQLLIPTMTYGTCDRNVWVEACLSLPTFRFVALRIVSQLAILVDNDDGWGLR